MGIYIKGMEMPKGCKDCGLKVNCDECEGWECVCVPLHTTIGYYEDLLSDKRRNDCPLVSVPSHGRMGDLDMLDFDNCKHFIADGVPYVNLNDIAVIIRDAPTIIQASDD